MKAGGREGREATDPSYMSRRRASLAGSRMTLKSNENVSFCASLSAPLRMRRRLTFLHCKGGTGGKDRSARVETNRTYITTPNTSQRWTRRAYVQERLSVLLGDGILGILGKRRASTEVKTSASRTSTLETTPHPSRCPTAAIHPQEHTAHQVQQYGSRSA